MTSHYSSVGGGDEVEGRPARHPAIALDGGSLQTHSRQSRLAGLAGLLLSSWPAAAQDQTLRIVFSFAAGGAADGIARLVADCLRSSLGRPVIVENIVGAGGRIGARAVKGAPPNGTELLFASNSQMTLQPHIYRDRDLG